VLEQALGHCSTLWRAGRSAAVSVNMSGWKLRDPCFAFDGFGTGDSSLTYQRRLPISTIKIDRSFVARMLVDSADQAIVRAVVNLAHAFGRACVAEGDGL
jgi:EAL domain-containing protein (putative c-di-GMP-specific phosphodiesterase class I)